MWRYTGNAVKVFVLDARACFPILAFALYWSWTTLKIAAIGTIFFGMISWLGLYASLAHPHGSALAERPGPDRCSDVGTAATRMSGIDLALVSKTTERYLDRTVRSIAYTCSSTGEVTDLSAKMAASPMGALPTLAVAAESLWCEGTGRHFGLDLALDPATSFGYRLHAIQRGPFTAVMLAIIEAIESARDGEMLELNRLADIWAQAEDRIVLAANRIAA